MKFLFLFIASAFALDNFETLAYEQKIVVATKQIAFEEFPGAFNPSVLKVDQGILMCFRHCPDPYSAPWTSYIGIVLLNDAFEPISPPQLVSTRSKSSKIQSQSEDARLFAYRGRTFLIYNDNMEVNCTSLHDRRDMYIAEVFFHNGQFTISAPLRLLHQGKGHLTCQKNWTPFEWNKKLLISYTVNPHEILYVNLQTGDCYSCYETDRDLNWEFGTLRDSSPPQLVGEEYLTFFHSKIVTESCSSYGWSLWHYFVGAYTFSPNPPFAVTSATTDPIVAEDFYTQSPYQKRVIFPGGFVVAEPYIYLAYGKDDHEIWIATLDKAELKKALK